MNGSCHYRIATRNRGDYYGGVSMSQAKKRLAELRGQGIGGRIVKSCLGSGRKSIYRPTPSWIGWGIAGLVFATIGYFVGKKKEN